MTKEKKPTFSSKLPILNSYIFEIFFPEPTNSLHLQNEIKMNISTIDSDRTHSFENLKLNVV